MEKKEIDKEVCQIEYPLFCDGTILTSNDLNKSFDFLHSQVKLTRNLLFGHGIVNGLTYEIDYAKGEVVIRPGVAITPKGSIIVIEEEQRHCFSISYETAVRNRIIPEGTMSEVQYILQTKQIGDSVEISKIENFSDYLLGLHVIHKVKEKKYCTDQSCSITGNRVAIEVIPFLTKKEDRQGLGLTDKLSPIDELQTPIEYGLVDYSVLPIFLRRVADRFYGRIEAILQSLEKIAENDDFSTILSSLLAPIYKESHSRLKENIDKLEKLQFDNKRIATYLSFADDVVDAVNEFIEFYNIFLSKYRIALSKRIEEAVILGRCDVDSIISDNYRYLYQETYQDFDRNKDELILHRLFCRINLLIECFVPEKSFDSWNVDFLPASVSDKLGERVIPFYYNSDKISDLIECWDAHNAHHIDDKLLLLEQNKDIESDEDKYVLPFVNAFRKANLYRLSGYDSVGVDGLRKRLQSEIDKYNLPVILLQHDIKGDEISFYLEDHNSNLLQSQEPVIAKNLAALIVNYKIKYKNSDHNELISPFIEEKDKEHIYSILIKVLETYNSPNNIDKASRILNDLKRNSFMEEIKQIVYLIVKETEQLSVLEKILLEFILMAILHNKDESIFAPNLMPGVDYFGGVDKGNILLMVSFKNKVLACLNMPYNCMMININKYKEQIEHYLIMHEERNFIPGFYPHENIIVYGESEEKNIDIEVGFDLFMIQYGRNKEHTANYLRERGKVTFRKAMEMVNNIPIFIFNETSREDALKVCFVMNERLKANLLIVPAGVAKTDSNKKLTGFSVAEFDVKVTFFEGKPQDAVEKLKKVTGFNNIEIPDQTISPRTIWIRNMTDKLFLGKLQELKKIDAVFEMVLK